MSHSSSFTGIPVVSLQNEAAAVQLISAACRDHGFFVIRDFGIDVRIFREMDRLSREFFALPLEEKMKIQMIHGGAAWRGYFPVGQELTSGKPDLKEGLYLGRELSVVSPLHGPNLFPEEPRALRKTVLDFMNQMEKVATQVMQVIALGLGLSRDFFERELTRDPLILFRIFHYPAARSDEQKLQWGVGEHTDYGLLTLLWQDENGGLEVKTRNGWVGVPPAADQLVCNIGDMLDLMTAGFYRSTLHRVRNTSGRDRISLPFFFDPGFQSRPAPIPGTEVKPGETRENRWDGEDLRAFQGTYGEYLMKKVSRVFPKLTF